MAKQRPLEIGTVGGKPFTLPLELASLTMAVLGIRGSGKTVTASVIAEEVIEAGIQFCGIDTTNVWWGLKSSRDGKSDGYPVVIFGGPNGDLPLTPDAGHAIADFVVDNRMHVILSVRHMRKGDQRRFVMEFCEQLYHRKGEPGNQTPLFLAIDEASQYVPQKVMGEVARLVGAVQDLVRLGRSSGFGVCLIDQRAASVNKDVLTQLELLVAHRITSPQDRKALLEWVDQNDVAGHRKEFLDGLASLPVGTAWFWAPGMGDLFVRVKVRNRKTFDSSKTPKIGERVIVPVAIAKVDLSEIEKKLSASIAAALANDPKVLKKRIAELERSALEARPAMVAPATDRAIARAVAEAERPLRTQIKKLEAWGAGIQREYSKTAGIVVDAANKLLKATETIPAPEMPAFAIIEDGDGVTYQQINRKIELPRGSVEKLRTHYPRKEVPGLDDRIGTMPPAVHGDAVSAPEQKVINALFVLKSIGLHDPVREVVAALCDYTASGGTFKNLLGKLRSKGLIEYNAGNTVSLTSVGQVHAAPIDNVPTLADLHDRWLGLLEAPHARVLRVLISAYPKPVTRDDLAEATGYTASGGTFKNILGRLRSLKAADYVSGGVVASDLLFPDALRYSWIL